MQDRYLKVIYEDTEKIIQKRKKEYETRKQNHTETVEKEDERTVVIDSLFAARDEDVVGLTDEDIKAEAITLILAVSNILTILSIILPFLVQILF